jgi:hypothetical protein
MRTLNHTPNSFASAASQNVGMASARKPTNVSTLSVREYCRTALTTPVITASIRPATVAKATRRNVTQNREATSSPMSRLRTDGPHLPWRSPMSSFVSPTPVSQSQ